MSGDGRAADTVSSGPLSTSDRQPRMLVTKTVSLATLIMLSTIQPEKDCVAKKSIMLAQPVVNSAPSTNFRRPYLRPHNDHRVRCR